MGIRTFIYKRTGIKLKKGLTHKKNIEKSSIKKETGKIKNLVQDSMEIDNKNISKSATLHCGVDFDSKATIDEHSYVISGLVRGEAHIGKYCSIAHNTTIGADKHPSDWLSTHPFQYKIEFNSLSKTTIGNDVWIGANAVIMTGIEIGDGAIIGAGAIVTKNVPPYSIVAGCPAKIIRYRFNKDIINKLLNLRWWDVEHHLLVENNIEFNNIERAIKQIQDIKSRIKLV